MSTDNNNGDNNNVSDICANCGKGEESTNKLKSCTACKLVKYCNRECQMAHRSQHKKECKKRAKELHDEALFKQPPPEHGDCPICFLRIPSLCSGSKYMACCGKLICSGCCHAPIYDDKGNIVDNQKCPFCRTTRPKTNKEIVERNEKRMEAGDAIAFHNQGSYYAEGDYGLPQDYTKALEFYHRAAKLGHALAYYKIGNAYWFGRDVEVDKKKAIHYYELAAKAGHTGARYILGVLEIEQLADTKAGDLDKALKHFMIAVRGGCNGSLRILREMYSHGDVTKEEYTTALRDRQTYLDEIKSDQRDKAAAASDDYKYY